MRRRHILFPIEHFEHTLLLQLFDHCRVHTAALLQCRAFHRALTRTEAAAQLHELHQCALLLFGTLLLECIEPGMQRFFIAGLRAQAHVLLGGFRVTLLQFLGHGNGAGGDQFVHRWRGVGRAHHFAQRFHGEHRLVLQRIEDAQRAIAQLSLLHAFATGRDTALAGEHKDIRQRGRHHFARAAQVVRGHVLPQCQLVFIHQWRLVEHCDDRFGLHPKRCDRLQSCNDPGVRFLPSATHWHHHAPTWRNLVAHAGRYGVRERAGECHRQ